MLHGKPLIFDIWKVVSPKDPVWKVEIKPVYVKSAKQNVVYREVLLSLKRSQAFENTLKSCFHFLIVNSKVELIVSVIQAHAIL